ncbi:MAG TPA: class I SAM-dependent methyltransferase [Armatimonadota bacterium]|nr:class I SAM-dependent methyltransferase [Armatimonadota bacterium]
MIGDLHELPKSWIGEGEVSLPLGKPAELGLSLFLTHPRAFSAVCRHLSAPPALLENDRRVRESFDVVPRQWVKLHYRDGALSGYSLYFHVDPGIQHPVTTLRTFLRRYGHADVSWVEPMLQPALERPETTWGLVLKDAGSRPRPRLSAVIQRGILPDLLERMVSTGFLTPDQARAYLAWNERAAAEETAYFSFDPGVRGASALDLTRPEASCLPEAWDRLCLDPTGKTLPRYLKCRIRPGSDEPEWSAYLPVAALLDLHATSPNAVTEGILTTFARNSREPFPSNPEEYREEVRDYYDSQCPAILTALGPTYQAGLVRSKKEEPSAADFQVPEELRTLAQRQASKAEDARESNRELARRAGIQPGQCILDAGCGAGGPAIDICTAYPGVTVEGITLSPVQAEAGQRLVQEAGLSERVRIIAGDYHALPYEDRSFDVALFLESSGYAYDRDRLFAETFRVLRPGGRLYIKDVFRKEGELSWRERQELQEKRWIYGYRPATLIEVMDAIRNAGFTDLGSASLDEIMSTEHLFEGMLVKRVEIPLLPQFGAPILTDFGRYHFHEFERLPVVFAEVWATKPE